MVLIHKKIFREDRLLQIAMALSLLRVVPDMFQSVPPLSSLVHHPLFEQHSAAMDYHGMTRQQVLQHLSQELLTRLHPDELRNLLNSQIPAIYHRDYGDLSGDLIDHHQDLGGIMGERRWHHHAGIGGSFDGRLENWCPTDAMPSVSMKERDAVIERLMALAGGSINARINGIFDDAAAVTSDTLLSEENQSPLNSTRLDKIEGMNGRREFPTEPHLPRRDIFNVQAYALVSQTSVIPNSTSSNGSRDNVLHTLSNPTPPSSVPTSPPASPLPQPPTALLNASTPPQSPSAVREDLPISSLGNTNDSPVPIGSSPRNFNGGSLALLGLSTTGLRINEGIILPELRAAWPYIDEYTIEDRALLQALWLQDQDLGVPRDMYEEPPDLLHQVEEQEAPLKNALLKGEVMLSGGVPDRDPPHSVASRDGGGGGGQPAGGIREAVKGFKEEQWSNYNFTLDEETGEHCPLYDCNLPEDLKSDINYTRTAQETQDLPNTGAQPSSEPCSSDTGDGLPSEQLPLYSAYDHLLCEPRQTSQQSQSKLVDDLFQEAANALLHEALASEISENIPTVDPLNHSLANVSILIPEVKLEESPEVTNNELETNASSDSACANISSHNLSTFLGEEVSGFINSFAESIPPSFSAGLFNNSDLNISLNEFDFEGFPEEPQVVNDNGPQSGVIKEENTTSTQDLSFGDSPFFIPELGFKSEDFANQTTEQQQRNKRPRLNIVSQLTTRVRRPSSSASSGHGTLSDDSEGDTGASNQPSASSLEEAFDLFSSIVNSNNSSNLDPSGSNSNNSGGANFNSEFADLGIGPESVDLGSLASLNCLNSSLDEMIQASYQHNRASQGRMGGMLRGGSMDQRWQDLASLLSLPSPSDPSTTPPLHPPPPPPPPTSTSSTGMTTHHHHHHHHHHPPPPHHHHHHHQAPPPPHLAPPHHNVPPQHQQPPPTIHHPHALYPAHEGVGGGSVPRGGLLHNATLPPALPDPVSQNIAYANSMGASSHLGASSSSGNNPNVSEHLPDHHHPHPHHQHHQYKMETSSPSSSLIAAAPPPPPPPSHPHDMLYYQSSGSGAGSSELASTGGGHPHPSAGGQHGDGFLSSILGEDDLHLMDMAIASDYPRVSGHPGGSSSAGSGGVLSPHGALGSAGDYSSGAYRGWSLSPDEQQRLAAPVAQKKHHMFGKRYFQDVAPGGQPHHGSNSSSLVGGSSSASHYPAPYQQPPSAMDTTPAPSSHIPDPMELKYSCSMDFRGHHEIPPSLEHIHHNHTYHLSPEGPSGLPRPSQRDPNKNKARKPEPERALTRDEKRARALNLPISCDDIIHLPMDEFNERISKYDLTENQLSLIRDIRRRGKNKVAAQNCRKRKLDQIMHLAEEVKVIQSRKNELVSQYEFLSGERLRVKHKFSLLYRHIFQHLRDSDGQPYSPHEYNLQQSGDGSVLLVPKSAPHVALDPGLPPIPSNSSKPDDDSSKSGRPSHQQPPHQHHTPH